MWGRTAMASWMLAAWCAVAQGQTTLEVKTTDNATVWPERYEQKVDLKRFPQTTPQESIRSIIKVLKGDQIAYMVAHLVAPKEVDDKLKGNMEAFRQLTAKATPEKNKAMIVQMQKLLDDGTWTMRRNLCWATVDGSRDLTLEKIGRRWFMHNSPIKRPSSLP